MKNVLFVAFFVLAAGCGSSQEPSGRTEPSTPDRQPAPSVDQPAPADETPPGDGLATSEPRIVVGTDACTTDADCVPDGCCHPSACVARGHQASCDDMVCTTECRYGTLDCGGACLCQNGLCAARLSTAPTIRGMDEVH